MLILARSCYPCINLLIAKFVLLVLLHPDAYAKYTWFPSLDMFKHRHTGYLGVFSVKYTDCMHVQQRREYTGVKLTVILN